MQLTERQARILKAVVEEHHESGRPVGSKTLVERGSVDASSSTVRYELGRLEDMGLLEHPHTSAGRVPTDLGYRVYVDHLLGEDDDGSGSGSGAAPRLPIVAEDGAAAIHDALADTTQALADATELLAVITAPRASGAVVRHVEVLQPQPTMLVVVIITGAGDVARQVVSTDAPVDPGLVDWAGEFLNEQVAGMSLGQNLLRQRLLRRDLSPLESAILRLLAPAFLELVDDTQEVHVGGSATMLARLGSDVQGVLNLVAVLDERRRLIEALRPIVATEAIAMRVPAARTVEVRIGAENAIPELQRLSVVGAAYGVGARPLGMVGLIGPRAMDYQLAMHAVHAAADGLSLAAESLYGR